ncbi:conserved hypothetical protein [Hyphomicrobiales bacterium]|nr:conserved hypothetical protein [Hyphomicrobiales bacterium]CAH1702748.1 hypothetical protein BOSEA1005_30620 [Hyphomicrobiales bacterium]CAI0346938.1 conserved hypothetical protein [Hyphomicrobiales bacterium]
MVEAGMSGEDLDGVVEAPASVVAVVSPPTIFVKDNERATVYRALGAMRLVGMQWHKGLEALIKGHEEALRDRDAKAPRGVLLLLKALHKSSRDGGTQTISEVVASCAAIEDTEHLMGQVKPHELSDLSRTDVYTYFEALAAAAERRS